jgi:hypothetical protein
MELRVLSCCVFFSVVGVFEIKVSWNIVFVRSRLVNMSSVFLALACSDGNCLADMLRVNRVVFIRGNRFLNKRTSLFIKTLSWLSLGWLNDETGSII